LQLLEGVRSPLDGGEFVATTPEFLYRAMPLLFELGEQHTEVQQKCRCRTKLE
jgi:hypothetical protein